MPSAFLGRDIPIQTDATDAARLGAVLDQVVYELKDGRVDDALSLLSGRYVGEWGQEQLLLDRARREERRGTEARDLQIMARLYELFAQRVQHAADLRLRIQNVAGALMRKGRTRLASRKEAWP